MIVLDAGAVIALLRFEAGASMTRRLIREQRGQCCMHALNVCEIYYGFARASDVATAERAVQMLVGLGIIMREDMDAAFWKDAGTLKANHRLSLADCFALALARRVGAELVTTDHHEMDVLVPLGLCPIRFIR